MITLVAILGFYWFPIYQPPPPDPIPFPVYDNEELEESISSLTEGRA